MKPTTIRNLLIVMLLSVLVSPIVQGITAAETGIVFPNWQAIAIYNGVHDILNIGTLIIAVWVAIKSEKKF